MLLKRGQGTAGAPRDWSWRRYTAYPRVHPEDGALGNSGSGDVSTASHADAYEDAPCSNQTFEAAAREE